MEPGQTAHGRHDRGFTLVEIVIAIVLVGVLSAVVVVGVGSLTSRGTSAACATSKDAARGAATVFFGSTGAHPTTFTQMTTTTPAALTLPNGATVSPNGLVVSTTDWTLTMTPGSGAAAPTFLCSTEVPPGFTAGPNGHFYRFVSAPGITRGAAATAAATYTFEGLTGYLATITSASEQATVFAVAGSRSVWVDGTDTSVEGTWRWTGGPETGAQFSSGASSVAGSYVNWAGGQPDNWGDEDCMHFYASWPNLWNDVPCTWPNNAGYIVELGT